MNQQETFNAVARHLLTQNEVSSIGSEGLRACVYRGPRGLKCAIGALVPDDMLHLIPSNNAPLNDLPETVLNYLVPDDMDADRGISFLSKLQRVHDCWKPHEWRRELASAAYSYNLSTDILEPSNIEDLVNELRFDEHQEEMVPA